MSYADRRRFLWILFLLGVALVIAVAASGTTMVALRFEELAQKATAVARLKCLSARSFAEGGEIWTETQFEVVKVEKGLLSGLVTVRIPGGRAEGVHARIDGTPEFATGEEVYLFLWGGSDGAYRVLGWAQGTFRIKQEARSGRERVTQDSANMAAFDPATRSFKRSGVQVMGVGEFEDKLRKVLAGGEK